MKTSARLPRSSSSRTHFAPKPPASATPAPAKRPRRVIQGALMFSRNCIFESSKREIVWNPLFSDKDGWSGLSLRNPGAYRFGMISALLLTHSESSQSSRIAREQEAGESRCAVASRQASGGGLREGRLDRRRGGAPGSKAKRAPTQGDRRSGTIEHCAKTIGRSPNDIHVDGNDFADAREREEGQSGRGGLRSKRSAEDSTVAVIPAPFGDRAVLESTARLRRREDDRRDRPSPRRARLSRSVRAKHASRRPKASRRATCRARRRRWDRGARFRLVCPRAGRARERGPANAGSSRAFQRSKACAVGQPGASASAVEPSEPSAR